MRTFKQIGEVTPDIDHYTYPRFRKPIKPVQEGELIKLVYTDGREDIIRITAHSSCDVCKGCIYEEAGYSCPVWCNGRGSGAVWCIVGHGHIAVSVDKIMEDLY